ncbi:hypothetical protein [Micromonospora sp. KC723]|uniref:hypothetical protein n=1 Tax=Micromonospora sp. KC723 TaxID=2530381 RepID=UPI001FB6DE5A|nr:hypothetical protein [Micromonospora sp. KC723]
MLWPLGQVHRTVQPLIALLVAVTVTLAPKPPAHSLVFVYVAVQPPFSAGGVVTGGVVGGVVGDVVGGVVVGGVVPPPKMTSLHR